MIFGLDLDLDVALDLSDGECIFVPYYEQSIWDCSDYLCTGDDSNRPLLYAQTYIEPSQWIWKV